MKNKVKLIVNPFIRIAGGQALIWGFLGLIVSTLLCWISGYHYHGLLHFGPAPNPAWWCYLAEHLIVWLIPMFFAISFKLPLDFTKSRTNCCSFSDRRASKGNSKLPQTSVLHSSQNNRPTFNGASQDGHCNGNRFFTSFISSSFMMQK